MLGVLATEQGRLEEGAELVARALATRPGSPGSTRQPREHPESSATFRAVARSLRPRGGGEREQRRPLEHAGTRAARPVSQRGRARELRARAGRRSTSCRRVVQPRQCAGQSSPYRRGRAKLRSCAGDRAWLRRRVAQSRQHVAGITPIRGSARKLRPRALAGAGRGGNSRKPRRRAARARPPRRRHRGLRARAGVAARLRRGAGNARALAACARPQRGGGARFRTRGAPRAGTRFRARHAVQSRMYNCDWREYDAMLHAWSPWCAAASVSSRLCLLVPSDSARTSCNARKWRCARPSRRRLRRCGTASATRTSGSRGVSVGGLLRARDGVRDAELFERHDRHASKLPALSWGPQRAECVGTRIAARATGSSRSRPQRTARWRTAARARDRHCGRSQRIHERCAAAASSRSAGRRCR